MDSYSVTQVQEPAQAMTMESSGLCSVSCGHKPVRKIQTLCKGFGITGPGSHCVEVKLNFPNMHYQHRHIENNFKTDLFAFSSTYTS